MKITFSHNRGETKVIKYYMLIAQLLTSSGLNVDVPQQLWTHPPSLQPNKVVCQSIEVAYDFLHCS